MDHYPLPVNFNIRKVLVAPLDWGLGHTTRCIPLIHELLAAGYEVVAAAEGAHATLLRTEFPALPILPLEGYRIRYSKSRKGLAFRLLLQVPRLLRMIRNEHRWLEKVIGSEKIDLVISDNRFGLFTSLRPCIFITHQLTIKSRIPWLENRIRKANYKYINRFTACWVPDMKEAPGAAGLLSHPPALPSTPLHYMGLLSRFRNGAAVATRYDACILLSGPEPQRSLLEEKILRDLRNTTARILFVRGRPGSEEQVDAAAGVEIKNHLPGEMLQRALLESELVICRSGYTTVMELMALQKKAVYIPTPGQTEQEYLAEMLAEKKACIHIKQEDFSLPVILSLAQSFVFQTEEYTFFDHATLGSLLQSL